MSKAMQKEIFNCDYLKNKFWPTFQSFKVYKSPRKRDINMTFVLSLSIGFCEKSLPQFFNKLNIDPVRES